MPHPNLHFSLVLAESEVAAVTTIDPDLRVRFSAAALLRSGAEADAKSAPGFGRGIVLVLRGAQVIGEQDPQLGRVARGRLQVAGEWLKEVRLPLDVKAPVHLELAFANRAYVVATGSGLSVRFEAEPNFIESFAC